LPDPDKLLTVLRQATVLSRATPGRSGRLVELHGASDVFVAGDLHGHIGNFQQVLKLADLGRQPWRHLVMQELIHGQFRYTDGSDKSHQAVDLWAALKCQYPDRVHYLPGNHEMAQWTNRAIAKNEYDLNAGFLDGVRAAYAGRASEVYTAYLDLFKSLPLALRTSNRVFLSHSLPNATAMAKFDAARLRAADYSVDDLKPGGSAYAIVWGRDASPANTEEFLKKVDADLLITGHIPQDTGFAVPNERQVILDTLGSPAAYCLFPADRPLTHKELLECVKLL
jgi:hypothetical protein